MPCWRKLPGCGHGCCNKCLKAWITTQYKSATLYFKCVDRNCAFLIPDDIAAGYVGSAEMKIIQQKRVRLILNTMSDVVTCSQCYAVGWVPVNTCGDVQCRECPFKWCSKCKLEPHIGQTCEEYVKQFGETNPDKYRQYLENKMSEELKEAITKACPNCTTRIIRNDGCSHMTCKVCKYEFCWLCSKKYQGKHVANNVTKCQCD